MSDPLVSFIRSRPGLSVTASEVAAHLQIPPSEAEDELCGLAGRCGGTFAMSADEASPVATFTFPASFDAVASAADSRAGLLSFLSSLLPPLLAVLRLLFGAFLLVSLSILAVAAFAAFLAVSQRGGGRGRGGLALSRHLRSVNNAAFFYHVMGGDNPFFNSLSGASYACSACVNPALLLNPFFLLRARFLARRRWAVPRFDPDDIPAFRSSPDAAPEDFPPLLTIIDHFLFGPPSPPYPSPSARTLLRVGLIQRRGLKITPTELLPFSDDPPPSSSDVSAAVRHIMYLRGVPLPSGGYSFPSLADVPAADADPGFRAAGFLYSSAEAGGGYEPAGDCLAEGRHAVTALGPAEFWAVAGLGALNVAGVALAGGSAKAATFLEGGGGLGWLAGALLGGMRWYAALFFLVPAVRAAACFARNVLVDERNKRRRALAEELAR
ncbi:hypothetical protein TeGR_g12467 [Tetraparma gracilis]|uniref:Uncharacterized protein n=1 Tax=Tetraparma gracilis TaxID=2962635 RepID=A0ABQ6NCW3_9STRA|nr:hypothetical protein TeGR_g12467 [Tetraparma gracilis]